MTPPAAADSEACTAVSDLWPETVGTLEQQATTSSSSAVAAWGDPPVIARCGVDALTPTTNECISVDGVDWVAARLSDGVAFTTYGTDPAIEVLVPSDHGPAPLLLPAFTEAAEQLPPNGRACVGPQ